MRDVGRLAQQALALAGADFDVIHAHDWMTYPAAEALHGRSRRPWIAHVHATEFSRSGRQSDPAIEAIERQGACAADRVICVSRRTAEVVRRRYGVAGGRLRVVHNAIDPADEGADQGYPNDRPLVLFVGRLTRQKAPAVFLEAARAVLERRPDAEFVLAGTGERMDWIRARAAELGISDRVSLPGFLPPEQLHELYRRASVYALPSIDEPFGMTVLEAARHRVPAVVSSGSGVIELVPSVIRVEPGDAAGLAERILFLLDRPVCGWLLARRAAAEAARRSWRQAAEECVAVYREVC
jgi:glycosyltransferase involved in cell wall biosynthesis